MSEIRLSNLALLSIEYKNAVNIDFDSIIDKFAETKARRRRLL